MATKNKRAPISIPPDQEERLQEIKQKRFPNTSQAEMYRQLIALGLQVVENEATDGATHHNH